MRKLFVFTSIILVACSAAVAQNCTTIKSGLIRDSTGNVLKTGYDKWGYNYQAHIFNGLYDNFSRPATPVSEGSLNLVMKWSDDWIANQDCNGDGKLDRGLDSKTGISDGISKGWCTNHFEGDYEDGGVMYHYTEEVKIVYVGPPPTTGEDTWATSRIWGSYAIVEDVINDNHGGFHGVDKSTLANPAGLGYYTH